MYDKTQLFQIRVVNFFVQKFLEKHSGFAGLSE